MQRFAMAGSLALASLLAACRSDHVAKSAPADASAPKSRSVTVPTSVIASGKSSWVDSNLDPELALLDARVDVGTLRQVGDELEATLRWPIGPGQRRDLQSSHPELRLPEGAVEEDRERLRCGRDRLQYFTIAMTYLAVDGTVLRRERFDVAEARQKEAARAAAMPPASFTFAKYGESPRDLVCWAAARKCRNEPFTWPPPPNVTRFDDPRYAELREAHDAQFIPSCVLNP